MYLSCLRNVHAAREGKPAKWILWTSGVPSRVKQSAKAGRPDIDAFEGVMIREERKLGYFVGFDFTGDARFEINRFPRKEGREIKPLTEREILDEEIAAKPG